MYVCVRAFMYICMLRVFFCSLFFFSFVCRSCEYLLKTQIRIVSVLLLEFINLVAGKKPCS